LSDVPFYCYQVWTASDQYIKSSWALTARAEGAHGGEEGLAVGVAHSQTFLSPTARKRAVGDEQTTFEKPCKQKEKL